jgi:site-specific recombinase XerD
MNNTGWKKAREEMNLPNLRVHDLRHTFASRLMQAGVSLEHRRVLLGHASHGTPTEMYSHADLVDLLSAVNRIVTKPEKGGVNYLRVV